MKNKFRKRALESLKSCKGNRARLADKKIINILKKEILKENPKQVMLYTPLEFEANIKPLIEWLRKRGISVFVPFMEGKSFRLVKYRFPLHKKRFGIYEPKFSKQYRAKDIDLAIVPVVGIDLTGRRVGFGKGMYDRFFAKEKKRIKKIIFVQRNLCLSKVILTDDWDVKGDIIVSKEGKIELK